MPVSSGILSWHVDAAVILIFSSSIDLIIVLKDGAVAEEGSHSELLENEEGVYSTLWRAQSQEATMESILDSRPHEKPIEVQQIQ